jgi:hypothetical protein
LIVLETPLTHRRGPPPPLDEEALSFQEIFSTSVESSKSQPTKFMKNLNKIIKVALPPSIVRKKYLSLTNRWFTGQFIGIEYLRK